jgi:hypothetical protein
MKILHFGIIIGIIIITAGGVLFVWLTWLNNETSLNMIQVSGTVITNSTTIPRFIEFTSGMTTKIAQVETRYYSIALPNDRSYYISVDYADKIPPVVPNNTLATDTCHVL